MIRAGAAIKELLDQKVEEFNRPEFIELDPILIPHGFHLKQDKEISGFFAAMLAWGQRKTIINKCRELMDRMDGAPYAFVREASEGDLKRLLGFKHRTFNDTDLLYFVEFLRKHYASFDSLEDAFLIGWHARPFRADFATAGVDSDWQLSKSASPVCFAGELERSEAADGAGLFTMDTALTGFREYFFSLPDFPLRTRKHISSPAQKSTCKRLNMYLRWMVRRDMNGVDFGLWRRLSPAALIIPYDVHVDRVARSLGLVDRRQRDWRTAVELTETLRQFDPKDPVKYDFALFGMGVIGEL